MYYSNWLNCSIFVFKRNKIIVTCIKLLWAHGTCFFFKFYGQAEASVRHVCEKISEAKQVFACHSCSPHTHFAVASLCLKEAKYALFRMLYNWKLIVKRMGQLSFDMPSSLMVIQDTKTGDDERSSTTLTCSYLPIIKSKRSSLQTSDLTIRLKCW